jgi:hypothetical protein
MKGDRQIYLKIRVFTLHIIKGTALRELLLNSVFSDIEII